MTHNGEDTAEMAGGHWAHIMSGRGLKAFQNNQATVDTRQGLWKGSYFRITHEMSGVFLMLY